MSGYKTILEVDISDDDETVSKSNNYQRTIKTSCEEFNSIQRKKKLKKSDGRCSKIGTKSSGDKIDIRINDNQSISNLIEIDQIENDDSEFNQVIFDEDLVDKFHNTSFEESFEYKAHEQRFVFYLKNYIFFKILLKVCSMGLM